ncbi:MAG: sulfite exporter TauE/SafE family protein [Candidatus Heimdallarchaeaceae archaeon]
MDIVLQLVLIGLLALGVAILGNIGGFGGGVILVPSLILIFSIDTKTAVGTVLAALCLPALVGTIGAARRKEVDFKFGILFAIPSAAGTIAGVFSVHFLTDQAILIIMGVLAFTLSLLMLYHSIKNRKKTTKENDKNESLGKNSFWQKMAKMKPLLKIKNGEKSYDISVPLIFFSGVFFGLLSGLLGISGGWIQTPFMILAFGLPPLLASGTSLFIIVIKALVGGITHMSLGNIDWRLLALLTVTMFFGAMIGNFLKGKMKGKQVSWIIGITLLTITIFIFVSIVV